MKKYLVSTIFLFFSYTLIAGGGWLNSSVIVYDNITGSDYLYSLNNDGPASIGEPNYGSNTSFSGKNFGTAKDIFLKGGWGAGWASGDWYATNSFVLYYRVYRTDMTAGNWSSINLNTEFAKNGNNYVYNNTSQNINVRDLASAGPGTYYLEIVISKNQYWTGGNYNSMIPGGQNTAYNSSTSGFKATFTVTSQTTDYFRSKSTGNWNTAATWESSTNNLAWGASTLVPGASAASIKILSGHNITLDGDVTIPGLTINSEGTFTSSDATPRILTIGKSVSGSSTTLSNSGTWANGAGGSTIVFTGAPSSGDAIHTISGTIAFQNITVNKTGGTSNVGASFGTGSTVSGTLEIGAGGFIFLGPPTGFFWLNGIFKIY